MENPRLGHKPLINLTHSYIKNLSVHRSVFDELNSSSQDLILYSFLQN